MIAIDSCCDTEVLRSYAKELKDKVETLEEEVTQLRGLLGAECKFLLFKNVVKQPAPRVVQLVTFLVKNNGSITYDRLLDLMSLGSRPIAQGCLKVHIFHARNFLRTYGIYILVKHGEGIYVSEEDLKKMKEMVY
jgi:hypothetical protein